MAQRTIITQKMTVRFRFLDRLKILFGQQITTYVHTELNRKCKVLSEKKEAFIHKQKKRS